MARFASIFAALSGGATMLVPDFAQPASYVLLGSTMIVVMTLSRRRTSYQRAMQVSD